MKRSQAFAFQPTPGDVLAARGELARRDIKWFARMIEIPGAPLTENEDEDRFHTIRLDKLAFHHEILLDALQEVGDGTLKNLIVIMPPGSAKSTYCSVVFPAWLMMKFARLQILLTSYGDTLALRHSRRCRQLVRSPSFQTLCNTPIMPGSNAAEEWALTNQAQYQAGGLTTGITGSRADVGICDDPIKGREAAESEVQRNKIEDAIRDDFDSRIKPQPIGYIGPRGSRIYITTRWHMLDPVGKILPEDWNGESGDILGRDGRMWRVICIPAQADRLDDPLGRQVGEYLWPEWFPESHWAPFRRHARSWNSLYQGKPTPTDGDYFKDEWLHEVESLPPRATLKVYGASDYAVTADGGDYTVHVVVGLDPAGRMYLLDLWRQQASSEVWVEAFCDLVLKWKPIGWAEETGQIKAGVGPFLTRRMREREARVPRETFPTRGDKAIRAQSIRGRMAMDGLYVKADAPWKAALISELMSFPVGVHDDQADALGLIGQILDRMKNGKTPPPDEPTGPPKGIRDMTFNELLDSQPINQPERI